MLVLAVAAIRYTEPVEDGDLFWQMAYGRYMVEHHTLRPDAAAFSWTPVSNRVVYCAWVGQLALYGLYSLGGLAALFVLRYLCLLAILWLAWKYSRQAPAEPMALSLALMMLALSSRAGDCLKPEMFSLFFFNLTVWLYFRAKTRERTEASRLIAWLPLIFCVWANTHGGFIFGLLFLFCVLVGETLNRLLSRGRLLSAYGPLAWSALASVAATFISPSAWDFVLWGRSGVQHLSGIEAYLPTFHAAALHLHYTEYFVIMAALLTLVFALSPPVDWALFFPNVVFGSLYLRFLRMTYFWPAVFAYTYILLGRRTTPLKGTRWVALIVLLLLAGRVAYEARYQTSTPRRWCGFGITYDNGEIESEWVARFHPVSRLYNTFNTGGWLIWRFYGHTRVMIDQRGYPYEDWYPDYQRWERGEDFEAFFLKYPPPCDVAVIGLHAQGCWRRFLDSPQWSCAFYGPGAAVFVRRPISLPAEAAAFAPHRFLHINNLHMAANAYEFARALHDRDGADKILQGMHQNFYATEEQRKTVDTLSRE